MSEQTTGKLSEGELDVIRKSDALVTIEGAAERLDGIYRQRRRLLCHIDYQDAEIERLTKELAAATAKLDALKVDPAKREELIAECHGRFQAGFPEGLRFVWRAQSDQFCTGFAAAIDHAFAAGRASAPEVADLQRQLEEATKRLAELTKGADDEKLARVIRVTVSSILFDNSLVDFSYRWVELARDVAARVRAPLLQQIAELKTALDFSNATREQADHEIEVLQKQAESSNQGTAASCVGGSEAVLETEEGRGECPECHYQAWVISAETGKVLFCKVCDEASQKRDALQMERELRADRDRLAAELGEAKQALATLTDERDRARDALRQVEAGVAAVQQALAEAQTELKTVESAIRISFSGPVGTPEYRHACEMLEHVAKQSAAPLTAAEFADLGKVLDAEAADHSVDANKKVEPPASEPQKESLCTKETTSSISLLKASQLVYPILLVQQMGEISEAKASELIGVNVEELRETKAACKTAIVGMLEQLPSPLTLLVVGMMVPQSSSIPKSESSRSSGSEKSDDAGSQSLKSSDEPPASEARRFACPKCGSHFCERRADGFIRCLGVGVLAWSGCPASASPEPGSMKVESGAGEGESAKGEQSEHKTPELIFSAGPLRNACQAGWHSARGEASLVYPCAVAARNEAQKIVDEAKEARDARARLGIVPGSSETLREKVDGLRQQLAAERQAREAADRQATEKILELERRCNDEHRKCEAAEQRAEQAEAAAGVMREAIANPGERHLSIMDGLNRIAYNHGGSELLRCHHKDWAQWAEENHERLKAALASDAGRAAANELRALRAISARLANACIGLKSCSLPTDISGQNMIEEANCAVAEYQALAGQSETEKETK